MSSFIQNTLDGLIGDGARDTQFEVILDFPNAEQTVHGSDLMMMVKTSQFPSKSNQTIDFKYKGRSFPVRGQVKYSQTWECSFYLTQDHKLKYAFENWIEALDEKHNYIDVQNNKQILNNQKIQSNKRDYTKNIQIFQKDFDDTATTAKYTLYNVFPTEIQVIPLSYESQGEVIELSVTFAYSYFTLETIKGEDGNFIDEFIGKMSDTAQNFVDGQMENISSGINSFIQDSTKNVEDWFKGINNDVATKESDKITQSSDGGISVSSMKRSIFDVIEN